MRAGSVDEGLTPTMAEREQPQLLLVSTAHRKATALMLGPAQVALEPWRTPTADLLIEWSAPQGADDRRRGGVAAGVAALDDPPRGG